MLYFGSDAPGAETAVHITNNLPHADNILASAPAQLRAQFACTTNTDGTLAITGYSGPGGNIVFPTNLNGMTVSALGENVLLFNTNVASITIPGSITIETRINE